jgi:putative copper export protein
MVGYNTLMLAHILAAMTWVGGLRAELGRASRPKDTAAAADFAEPLSFTGFGS